MLRRLENKINEIEPNLVDFGEVPFVQESIGDSLCLFPFQLASSKFLGYFLEIRALLELLILCAVFSLSKSEQLGNGPFSKRDPSPPDIAGLVLSIAQIGVEFLHQASSDRL